MTTADDEEPGIPPTHIIYTPVWHPDDAGGKFRKWLLVGKGWRGDNDDSFRIQIESTPINAEETATGYFRGVPAGAPPPKPLTMSRYQFLEQEAAHG
jgi:hypothetical protein